MPKQTLEKSCIVRLHEDEGSHNTRQDVLVEYNLYKKSSFFSFLLGENYDQRHWHQPAHLLHCFRRKQCNLELKQLKSINIAFFIAVRCHIALYVD
jgi:hypothetical protein